MDIDISPEIFTFDIFAKKISLFYNAKDKIGSYFGLILTFLYIISSISIFIFFLVITYQRKDFQVSDSMIYSQDKPTFKLNVSNSFFCIIGVLNKNNSKYIDESIYKISAIFYYQYKDLNGYFVNKKILDLPIERCKKEKYKTNILNGIELNNSYCIGDSDINLIGERLYNNYSFIEIEIYQCINSTENTNCKSQEIIDETLEGGQFSVQLKNIELNPNNYSYPILPTVYEFFSSISKYFYKNIIFSYKNTKVESYTGLFYEKQSISEDIKLDDTKEDIYYARNNNKIISKMNIRLSHGIHMQKRIYKNLFDVLALTAGYMNAIYCLFYLISFIYNNFKFEKIIVNSLLNMDIKYEKKFPSRFFDKRNSTIFIDNSNVDNRNTPGNRVIDIQQPSEKINIPIPNNKRGSVCIESLFHFNSKKNNRISFINDVAQFSFMDHSNNASQAEIMPKPVEMKLMGNRNLGEQSMNYGDQSMNLSVNKSVNKSVNNSVNKSVNKSLNRNANKSSKLVRSYSIFYDSSKKKKMKNVKVNIFEFYFGKFINKKKKLELLNKCSAIYKERMDLINLFRDLVIFENCLRDNFHFEKNGLNDEIKIFSNKKI